MKKLTILSAIALSGLIYSTANAQIGIHVGFHFGTPVYTPQRVVVQEPVYTEPSAEVYNSDDDYYYLPDVDAYYSVSEQCYYYNDGENWIAAAYLPGAYRDYDWRSERRYEVRAPRPYMHDDVYRSRYNGHAVMEFRNQGAGFHGGGYVNADRSANYGYRNNGQRFDNNRVQGGYSQPMDQNRSQRFDRVQGGYSQPAQQDRGQRFDRGQGGFNQPVQQNRGQGGYQQSAQPNNGQNRGQGGYTQPSQPNHSWGGNGQPSNPNRGQDNGNHNGGGQHFTQASPQGGYSGHRIETRF
ncbi:MAG TPA: hypothetical protein VNW95_00815 [Mucilaginibacter sp.]|nr:hypothetical protein [Mucilaginibacter sp.]